VLHPVAELPEARVRVRREVIPAYVARPGFSLSQSPPCCMPPERTRFALDADQQREFLHDPGAQPPVVLVLQDLGEIQVVQGHVDLDSCSRFRELVSSVHHI
jgi:hypothetical protein